MLSATATIDPTFTVFTVAEVDPRLFGSFADHPDGPDRPDRVEPLEPDPDRGGVRMTAVDSAAVVGTRQQLYGQP